MVFFFFFSWWGSGFLSPLLLCLDPFFLNLEIMDKTERLNKEIRTSRQFLKDLEMDPKLNSEVIQWMRWMLKRLEAQALTLELLGFRELGNVHSTRIYTMFQN